MKKKHFLKPNKQRKLALDKINSLFIEAKKAFDKDPNLSNKYASLARRTAMKFKVKIPSEYKRRICKNCHKYLVPGRNCRIRTRKGHMVYYCLNCKNFMRIGYK